MADVRSVEAVTVVSRLPSIGNYEPAVANNGECDEVAAAPHWIKLGAADFAPRFAYVEARRTKHGGKAHGVGVV